LKRSLNNLAVALPSEERINEFRQDLIKWFREHGRHFLWRNKSATLYQRIIAEVLLQRTQAGTAGRFLPRFLSTYPSWKRLSQATEQELMEYLKPIGLWRQRASVLTRLASEMVSRKGRFPNQREEIEELPGIGQYIASAVLLFQSGERQPLLDSNMARLLERYFGPRKLVDIRYDPYLQTLSRKVLQEGDPIELNWAMLDHAALICILKRPLCISCPLNQNCRFFNLVII
jgi:A/G-specific adenine glycosylase